MLLVKRLEEEPKEAERRMVRGGWLPVSYAPGPGEAVCREANRLEDEQKAALGTFSS